MKKTFDLNHELVYSAWIYTLIIIREEFMLNSFISSLDKHHIIAGKHYNRWLVPPAALAIHLCIGMAYGFSVFWLPLSKAIGIKEPLKCGPEIGFF